MAKLPDPLHALVIEHEKKVNKNGGLFWQVLLKTPVGNIKANMWNAPDDVETNMGFPHLGDIISITALEDQLAIHHNVVIKGFNRILKDELPDFAKCIVEVEKASPQELKEALKLIGDHTFWESELHHAFMLQCFKKLDPEKLKKCPAASHVHHRYEGGLLIHSAEVLKLCRQVVECSPKYSFLSRDVLYTSAILHDMGKVETYRINDMGMAESNLSEKTLGHIFYSVHLVASVAETTTLPIEKEFVSEVLHCIATHHGEMDLGSFKQPQSLEAVILNKMDIISSRMGMLEATLREAARSNQTLSEDFRIYKDEYFSSNGMKNYITKLASEIGK